MLSSVLYSTVLVPFEESRCAMDIGVYKKKLALKSPSKVTSSPKNIENRHINRASCKL